LKKKILTCVGTRPNFVKVLRLRRLFEQAGYDYRLLHTGQHFDDNMSGIFFEQLRLGKPDFFLGIGGGTNNEVVGKVIISSEKVICEYKPDLVIVPGDVNSTFACAFAAASLSVPVAHIESGLRSFDKSMPEERNRILTDRLASLLFVTEPIGATNLLSEGTDPKKIVLSGNTIVDALKDMLPFIEQSQVLGTNNLEAGKYILCTFHRPVNVDKKESLQEIVHILRTLADKAIVVFPAHPRTINHFQKFDLFHQLKNVSNIRILTPQGYIEFLVLMKNSLCIVSDSGGVQIESSFFDIPCFTVRETTELKITLERGTNSLVPLDADEINSLVENLPSISIKRKDFVQEWDGNASERIVHSINQYLS